MKKTLLNWLACGVLGLALIACESDSKNARLEVWLTDAPGDYQEVNIDIQGVEIHTSENDNEKGWTSLEVNKGVYNMLKLTNGIDTLLAVKEIPAGKISQIRLKLGDGNTIKVDGKMTDLIVPSGQPSGLKLQVHENLSEGITYKILLDFDVARSIVASGNASYKLKPVIRTITKAVDGAIKGVVSPKESTPAIYAIIGDDTLGTTYPDTLGHFLLRGLPAGSYNVTFEPNSDYQKIQKSDVSVQLGVITDLETVTIPKQ
jgi:hypothetical protein